MTKNLPYVMGQYMWNYFLNAYMKVRCSLNVIFLSLKLLLIYFKYIYGILVLKLLNYFFDIS